VIRKFVIPKELGDSIEVRLLQWCKAEGELVNTDDALLEFETDKAIVLVTASQAGVLRKCFFGDGDWMKPGDVAAWLSDQPGEALPEEGAAPDDTLLVSFDAT
jgi:pyruvate/2-oxoglutarate dehydrogenase complex dihydrolipoamide acyltransferase (E2) component